MAKLYDLELQQRELLLRIAKNCINFKDYFLAKDRQPNPAQQQKRKCAPLLDSRPDNRLLPTPWCGHINAPIMFISSNPAIDDNELSPTTDFDYWSDDKIVDFFDNRFVSDRGWTKLDGNNIGYLLKSNHLRRYKNQSYWRKIQEKVLEFQEMTQAYVTMKSPMTLKQCVLTEVVHCGSKKNKGVNKVMDLCSPFLKEVLEAASNAKIIFIVGGHAVNFMNQYFKTHPELKVEIDIDWHPTEYKTREGVQTFRELPAIVDGECHGRKVMFIAIPHQSRSNCAFHKSLIECLKDSEAQMLRKFCVENIQGVNC